MAAIKSTRALTASTDGSDAGAAFNVDTVNNRVQVPNGATIQFYSDAYNTNTGQIGNGTFAGTQSATAPDPGANGTIATASLGVSRISPAANRTGCILQAGTIAGQQVAVVNESANSVTFAVAGTSTVSGGTGVSIAGGAKAIFIWDSSTLLLY